MKKFFNIIFILFFLIILTSCNCGQKYNKAVWWWDNTLDQTYLSFAKENNITSIYFCDSSFDKNTSSFISQAHKFDISVYLLAGEYQWLTNNENLYALIENYVNYQNTNPSQKFSGIHLDIEPHQDDNFDTPQGRQTLITSLITLCYDLSVMYPNIYFDYDIPFWFDDQITFNNQTLPAYAHMINYADNITIMAYRDNAQDIYNCAYDEIQYAISKGKTLTIGVETKSNEGDKVSFMEEGKLVLNSELDKLKTMIPDNFGIAIHQIKDWYDLKK